ncbi:MAG: hypothetical protein ACXACR_07810, partial [Candidatus Hodarchaeales archaeon]
SLIATKRSLKGRIIDFNLQKKEKDLGMSQGDTPQFIKHDKLDQSYGFFLYFFDETRGHIPLFVYPVEQIPNETEKQILSIHSIWWHQDKFLETTKFTTMDLELGGTIYSATLFLCNTRRIKKRFGMDSTKWQRERFVLIVRAPSQVSFIAHEILQELKNRIQSNVGENLCHLVEKNLRFNENLKIEEELIEKADNVEKTLVTLCESLIPKIPISKLEEQFVETSQEQLEISENLQHEILNRDTEPDKPKKFRFSIPTKKTIEIKKGKPVLQQKSRRVKIIHIDHGKDDNVVRVTIRNNSLEFINEAVLKIYESQGFFAKDILVSTIRRWAPKKEVTLEFKPTTESGTKYFLKIEDKNDIIKVKRIIG